MGIQFHETLGMGLRVNSIEALPEEKKTIVLGSHVGVGFRAMCIQGARVGDGSIVGEQVVVCGAFPNNCTIGGCPARILRANRGWARYAGYSTPMEYMRAAEMNF